MANYESLQNTFDLLVADRSQTPYAQLVVYKDGERVVNLAGKSDAAFSLDQNTPFLTFSVSKAFTACAILHLLEQGKIELDAPIAGYWPQFAYGGKETATIRHALTHQAGVPAPHLNRQILLWPFWSLVTWDLARTKAVYPPGTQTAYHLVNFGFILGEVVRRVSGLPIDQYLQKHFFLPLGLQNTWMRIPKSELKRSPKVFPASDDMRTSANLFNLRRTRRALIPAAGLHSTAHDLALFFQMLLDGGRANGHTFLKPETISMATSSQNEGYDAYVHYDMNWGFGFIIGGGSFRQGADPTKLTLGYGSSTATFSAMGMGTCMVWADRQKNIVTAFTCNGMLGNEGVNQRWATISNAVWDAVG